MLSYWQDVIDVKENSKAGEVRTLADDVVNLRGGVLFHGLSQHTFSRPRAL